MELTQEQLDMLATMTFKEGAHDPGPDMCWMEALALLAQGYWTDLPPCVPYEIAKICQQLNDSPCWADDATRTMVLRPRTPYLVRAERGFAAAKHRAYQAADFAREAAVRALGTPEVEALAPIVDRKSAEAAWHVLSKSTLMAGVTASEAVSWACDDSHSTATYHAANNAVIAAYYAAAYVEGVPLEYNTTTHTARLRILDTWIGYPTGKE